MSSRSCRTREPLEKSTVDTTASPGSSRFFSMRLLKPPTVSASSPTIEPLASRMKTISVRIAASFVAANLTTSRLRGDAGAEVNRRATSGARAPLLLRAEQRLVKGEERLVHGHDVMDAAREVELDDHVELAAAREREPGVGEKLLRLR